MFQQPEITDEQRAELEKIRMRNEDLFNRLKRLIVQELSPDQLQVLHATYNVIANSNQPASTALWYEGIIQGALFTRDIRLSESLTEDQPPG